MSEVEALRKDVEDLKKQVEYLSSKVKYLSFWNGHFVRKAFREADLRAEEMQVSQSVPEARPGI